MVENRWYQIGKSDTPNLKTICQDEGLPNTGALTYNPPDLPKHRRGSPAHRTNSDSHTKIRKHEFPDKEPNQTKTDKG